MPYEAAGFRIRIIISIQQQFHSKTWYEYFPRTENAEYDLCFHSAETKFIFWISACLLGWLFVYSKSQIKSDPIMWHRNMKTAYNYIQ